MQYLGGKARLAKKFAPILIEALERRGGRLYEPFVGGFNIVPALRDAVKDAHCSDVHPGVITLYLALQGGWVPPTKLTKEEYDHLRTTNDWANPLTAFAAFGCSFGGKEWGGYAVGENDRNYALGSKNTLTRAGPNILKCSFHAHSYDDWAPVDCVVYCDPPYRGTTGYKTGAFDFDAFDAWCEATAEYNDVFVSEFAAPEHWETIWEHKRQVTVARDTGYHERVDRIYRPRVLVPTTTALALETEPPT